ncbi:hypothetical protein [Leuconostoc lactis]|uniref:hypothetical protein n=1 Tax=Leuconostoc lactis TaxID=1246 RepID=UPI00020DA01D|nr:hypothetical protein [Leuconostoc lactis]
MTDELVVQVAQGQLLGTKEGQTHAFYDIPYGHSQDALSMLQHQILGKEHDWRPSPAQYLTKILTAWVR